MADPFDPARYVPTAATAVRLPLAPDDLAGVIGFFAVLARVAEPLMAFKLPEGETAAAVFAPKEGEGT